MTFPCYVIEDRNHGPSDEWHGERFDLVRVDTGETVAANTYGLFLGPNEGQVALPGALWKVRHVAHGGPAHVPGEYHSNHSPKHYRGDKPTEDHWLVLTPAGAFCCHCAASDGELWTVTGEAPHLTVTPSIHLSPGSGPPHEWHGWLTNGELVA